MLSAGTLLLLAMLTQVEPNPGAVEPLTLRIDAVGRESGAALAGFVAERSRETWGAVVVGVDEPTVTPRFAITLAWDTADLVELRIEEQGRELLRRRVTVAEPAALKLVVWLIVKSAVERAMVDAATAADLGPPPPVETSAPAGATVPPPVPAASPAAAAPAAQTDERPRFDTGLLVSGVWGGRKQFALGPSVAVSMRPWSALVVGFELGYWLTPALPGPGGDLALLVHHLPLALSAGWALDPEALWEVVGFAQCDLEVVRTQRREGTGTGVEAGAFVRTRLRLADVRAHLVVRLGAAARLRRQRYLLDDGVVREGPYLVLLSAGVTWP
jgi:hypothetical protein